MQHDRLTATREQLWDRIADLERERDQWISRAHGLLSMLPDETPCGDIQNAVTDIRAEERERLERICRNVAAELEASDKPISSVGAIECANRISALGDN